ncbi:hypothetical protein GCM10009733_107330 [Nonomuraea maheshkhaliensis]|uniref:Uncharacterized protein n=1 Tax=Nonomuraea maheshkhaliensis TaxID=419590 RepID=A0ABN2HV22_9ACTN
MTVKAATWSNRLRRILTDFEQNYPNADYYAESGSERYFDLLLGRIGFAAVITGRKFSNGQRTSPTLVRVPAWVSSPG